MEVARGQGLNLSAAVTYTTAAATPDPLTHCTGPGIESVPPLQATSVGFLTQCTAAGAPTIVFLSLGSGSVLWKWLLGKTTAF